MKLTFVKAIVETKCLVNETNELFVSNRKLRKQLKEAEECIARLQEQLQLENE